MLRNPRKPAGVRDYLPLQQGLRLSVDIAIVVFAVRVRDYLPLQQGLRHSRP